MTSLTEAYKIEYFNEQCTQSRKCIIDFNLILIVKGNKVCSLLLVKRLAIYNENEKPM